MIAIDWVNQLTVIESPGLLGQARLFVGIDSGPLHLATTLGGGDGFSGGARGAGREGGISQVIQVSGLAVSIPAAR